MSNINAETLGFSVHLADSLEAVKPLRKTSERELLSFAFQVGSDTALVFTRLGAAHYYAEGGWRKLCTYFDDNRWAGEPLPRFRQDELHEVVSEYFAVRHITTAPPEYIGRFSPSEATTQLLTINKSVRSVSH